MLKNLLLYTNDFLALFVMQLTIITVISIQIYALIKVKLLQRKYYIFLLIKILEIIFFKYEIFYMYLILFIIGVILNILLAINDIGNNNLFYSSFNNYFWNIIFNTIEFYL